MCGNLNTTIVKNGIETDPIVSTIFNVLADGEKCVCEIKEAIGIPQTWESYDLMMLEDLDAIKSRTVNGHKHYSLSPSRSLWYLRRSMTRQEPVETSRRQPVKYESAIEWLRPTLPHLSEFEAVFRRGF